MSRPKSEWHTTKKKETELKKESKKDLQNIKSNFEEKIATYVKKREQKKEDKASKFSKDAEKDSRKRSEMPRKTKEQHARERKKFRGKRNSPGARAAGFKGGIPNKNKVKFVPKNAPNKGGIIGAKKARIEANKKQQLEQAREKRKK